MRLKPPMPFARVGQLLPLALLPVLTGCLYTGPMWHAANERLVVEPRMFGVIERPAGTGGVADDGGRMLVVRFSIHSGEELYATIPLTPDGCPVEPFRYTGDKQRPEEIVADLPQAQRRQLRETRLALYDEKWAKRLEGDPNFRRTDWQTDGSSVPYDAASAGSDDAIAGGERHTCPERFDVRVRALRLGRPWTDAESDAMPLPVGSPVVYPPDACVLILPYAQPRPPGHRRAAQRHAVLMTPFTAVGDAVVIPLIFIACYGFGMCP